MNANERTVMKAAKAAGYKGNSSGWIYDPEGTVVCQGWGMFAVLFAVKDGALVPLVIIRKRGLLGFDAYDAKEDGGCGDWITNAPTAVGARNYAAAVLVRRNARRAVTETKGS